MKQIFPFLIDAKEQEVSANIEKAIVTCIAHSRVFDNTLPRERQEGEALLAIAQVRWPILLKRVYDQDRAYLFDLIGVQGEEIRFQVPPDRVLNLEELQINPGESYEADLIHVAEALATPLPQPYRSSLVTEVIGLPVMLGKERHLETSEWGTSLLEGSGRSIQQEKEMFEAWVQNLRAEDLKLDQLIQCIKEKSTERTEQLVRQRDKALLLLREEIESMKPQVDRRISDLNQEYRGMANQDHEIKQRMNGLEQEISQIQAQVQRYKAVGSSMAGFFEEQLRVKREEFARISELQTQYQTGWSDELSAQSYLARRPLEVLQEQLKEAELQWRTKVQQQQSLEQSLTRTLQEEQLKIQASSKELLQRSFVIGSNLPDEVYLELPFVVAKAGTPFNHHYYVIAPGRLKSKNQISGFFTNLLGRLNIPYAVRDKAWEAMAASLENFLNKAQGPAKLQRLIEDQNLLEDPEYWMKALEGINELEAAGLLSLKESENLKEAVVKNWSGRTVN